MMHQIVHNLALGAALIALAASLWQDWGTLTTVKRMLVSYLFFYLLGALLTVAVKLVGPLENSPDSDQPVPGSSSHKNRKTDVVQ